MTRISLMKSGGNLLVKIGGPFLAMLLLLVGLNYQQLYSVWAIRSETKRLVDLATKASEGFQNPPPSEDHFAGRLSSDFWEFTTINGSGQVSNEMAWHSTAIVFDHSLTIRHFSDPSFRAEKPDWHAPAADQYNNVSLIGGSGFRPSISSDVVLKFTMHASKGFYGTAGVVFQPIGTLQKDGWLVKPFDMFGVSIVGEESLITGINGTLCYLALNMIPVYIEPLQVDSQELHTYEIRLHRVSQTEWLGSLKVDDGIQCQTRMPAFGPVEVHAWSDNALVTYQPRRWWEIGSAMGLHYQDGGDKQFSLGMIRIFEAAPETSR